jgi:outer membrane protein
MTAVRRLITTILLSLMATTLLAQTGTTPSRATQAVTAETDRDATNPRALTLTLDQAVETSIERNLGIDVQRYEFRIAAEEVRRQYGPFDPILEGTVRQSAEEQTALTALEGGSDRSLLWNFGVRHFLPTGGSYNVGFNNTRVTRSGPFVSFSPGFQSTLDLGINQPLLRDFGIDVNRRGINIARNTLGINRELFRDVLMDTTLSTDIAYLDLVYARRNVEVVKEALFLARDQARITQIRIDVGASAPLDILQPNVQIARSEESLIRAVALVRDAEDRLRRLMNLDPSEWDRPIIPSETTNFQTTTTIDLDRAVAQAIERRPEVRQSALQMDNFRINHLYARNQMLPTLDLNAGYGLAGIGGRTLNPQTGQPDPTVPETGYGNALESIFANDFPSWNIGFTIGLPLSNIGARAAARQAELDVEQSRQSDSLTRQNIAIEVRSAVRNVDTTARSIEASRAAREAAERNVEAERKRYENGMTTNFQVLEVQQQLSDARRAELQAIIGHQQAVAAYRAAVGEILETHDISVEEPAQLEEPSTMRVLDRYNWLNYGHWVRTEEPKK